MRLTVVEQISQRGHGDGFVIVLNVLQNEGKIRSRLIIIKLYRAAVAAQQVREQKLGQIDHAVIGAFIVIVGLPHHIEDQHPQVITVRGTYFAEELQIVGLFRVMRKKLASRFC